MARTRPRPTALARPALLLGVAAALGMRLAAQQPVSPPVEPDRPIVYTAEVDGIIHPVSAEVMSGTIAAANEADAALIVFTLRTPGGLVDSTRAIISTIIASDAPVAVLVAPSGARAASAGFILVLAADVAAMAHGTHIGAAHPVSVGGGGSGGDQDTSETMAKKAASDVAAYARSLAEARKRTVARAAEAVTESRAFTDTEALNADPPLIDLIAADVEELVASLDGREVRRFDGEMVTLELSGARVVHVEMTRRQQFLSAIAHPQVAYLLFTLGVLGLTVELWNPGAVVPGVVGGLCLLLAFFAFQVLPIDTTGLLLIGFGLALVVAEIFVPSFGVLGIGGAISLVIGSLMLTDEIPGVRPNRGVIAAAALALVAVMLFVGRLAVYAHRQPPATGAEGMVRERGRALVPLGPELSGQVAVHGEIWSATATSPVAAGEPVVVVAVNGLQLLVEPAPGPLRGGASS